MQFVSGNPNLVDYTRFLVNDPSTAVTTQFSTQEVKDSVNLAYFQLLSEIKAVNDKVFKKVSFADTVEDQVFYALPSGFNRAFLVQVDYDANDLDTGTTKNPKDMDMVSYELLKKQQDQALTGVYSYAQLHQHFAIYPTTDNSGTNSIRIVWEFEPTALSADSDEPIIIPVEFHRLLCLRAAKDLKISRDMDYNMLERENLVQTSRLIQVMQKKDYRSFDQFATTSFLHEVNTGSNQGKFNAD